MSIMRRKCVELTCGLIALVFSFACFAGSPDWYNWFEPLTVKDVRVQSNRGIISFRTDEPANNPKGCSTDYYAFPLEPMGKELLSVLLAAQVSGRKVGINVDGTACEPYGRILVTQVRVL